MKVKITAEVDDKFEKGECNFCPFAYADLDSYGCWEMTCIMGKGYWECPIEVDE